MALMKKLTPYFVDLTKDACLKAFWRRRALHTFLIQHKISDAQLDKLVIKQGTQKAGYEFEKMHRKQAILF